MAKEQLNDYTYEEMLVTPGYDVDFAVEIGRAHV